MEGDGWCTIESDPGVFTELLEQLGVKNCQVAELYSLDDVHKLKPVHGLTFLFKWQSDETDNRPVDSVSSVFFANQVINNACATQALLSILMNARGVDIGDELSQFKEFSKDLPPEVKGLAIGNSEMIRKAHNSFARPEPFQYVGGVQPEEPEDVFHFISYIPFEGRLYELDGLKAGPIDLGDCTDEDWLDKAKPEIQKRIERYSRSEIRFNLMALTINRLSAYASQIAELEKKKEDLAVHISAAEAAQPTNTDEPLEILRARLQEVETKLQECQEGVAEEEEKRHQWKLENIRRRHNYIPFIMQMLRILAEKGELVTLIEQAKQKEAQKKKEKKESKGGKK